MSDITRNDIEQEEQMLLDQMVTEALLRDSKAAPDAKSEWERLAARMAANSSTSASVENSYPVETSAQAVPMAESEEASRRFSLRALWTVVGTVAAIGLVVVLLNIKGIQEDKSSLYQAKAVPTDIVILDEQENERVVKGNELTLAQAQVVENHTVVIPEGKDMKLTLADGTQVWLNANSRFTYPTAFAGKERKVTLQGEAYFKVAHDAQHPFIVKAGDMQTRVLGTEFNVDASDTAHPHVTLVQGSVSVSSAIGNADKVIAPGEDAAINAKGDITVSHVDTNDVGCWKDGIQLFDDVTLRDILMQMGSWYNVNVVCHNDAALNTHLRYMYDRKQGLEEAVKMLNQISNNKIKLHNNTILVE